MGKRTITGSTVTTWGWYVSENVIMGEIDDETYRSRGSVPGLGLHLVRVQLAGSVSAKRRKEFQRDEEDLSFSREKDE